jgi:hypothetical protein
VSTAKRDSTVGRSDASVNKGPGSVQDAAKRWYEVIAYRLATWVAGSPHVARFDGLHRRPSPGCPAGRWTLWPSSRPKNSLTDSST